MSQGTSALASVPSLNGPFASPPSRNGDDRGDVGRTQSNRQGQGTRPSLRTNFLWTLAGNVVYAGCQWGMLIVLAKLGTPAMVGEFSLGLAICAPIFMLSNLNLRGVQATDARGEY